MQLVNKRAQSGIALAFALIILVVLTILGVAAMRSSKLAQRLSDNAQSRMTALQQAQSMTDAVEATASSFPILPGTNYFLCFLGNPLPSNVPPPIFGGKVGSNVMNSSPTCANYTDANLNTFTYSGALAPTVLSTPLPYGPINPLNLNTYAASVRVASGDGSEFVVTSALRGTENSGRDYDFASFLVTGGYDAGVGSVATSTAQGVAEVNEGVYVRHSKATGVSNQ